MMRTARATERYGVLLAALVTAGAVGCGETATVAGPSALSSPLTTATLPTYKLDGADPADGIAHPELAAVRRATAAFHDPTAAAAAGYAFAGEPCVASPAGGMGIHAVNQALASNQAIDPLRPEALLYVPRPGGGLQLVGVEYLQAVLLRNTVTGEVGPWFSSAPWPATYQVVTPTPSLFGQTFDGPMPGHAPGMPWHWDLHAWVWAHNPLGPFEPFNPAVSCAG